MKIIELKIEDTDFSGVDAVALVESPAIEMDFVAFNKQYFETYNDYPQAAVDAARQGIKRNEELGNKCATQVGKVRAQQLVNGEKLSLDTIKRMRSFLIRQKNNYDLATSRKDYDACGYISYLLWGGPAALPWAEKKLRQAGEEFSELKSNIPQIAPNEPINFEGLEDACQSGYKAIGLKTKNGRKVPNCVPVSNFNDELEDYIKDYIISQLLGLDEEDFEININALPNFVNEASSGGRKKDYFAELKEKQMIVGPLMTPGKLIPRKDEETGEEYQVFFTKDTIQKIAYKMMQDKLLDSINIEHDNALRQDDIYLVETWIVLDPKNDKANLYGFTPTEGEWYGMYKIDKN